MPSAHATLGPSAAKRWLRCPASIRMSQKVTPQEDSPHAMEGTMAHDLAEIEASHRLLAEPTSPEEYRKATRTWMSEFRGRYGDDQARLKEMRTHVGTYLNLIDERLHRVKGSALLLEKRVQTGVEGSWGTADTIIVSGEHVEIIDLKYGKGVPVDAYENPQLKLYGVGALDTYGDVLGEVDTVYMTICQPRLDSISTYEMTPEALRAWRDGVVAPIAEQALGSDAPFNPSEEACHWCPAAGICKPRAERSLQMDFGTDPDMLTPGDLAEILPRLKEISEWCAAVKQSALERAYSKGETIPGHKIVRSGGRRTFQDDAIAIQTLIDHGYAPSEVATTKLKGVTVLEKLLGKEEFAELLAPFTYKSEGSLSLVPLSDKRPEVTRQSSAAADFATGGGE